LSRLEIGDYVGGMGRDIGYLVAPVDQTIGIDQITVAHGEFGVLVVRCASYFVLRSDRAIRVAQQTKWEVLRFGKRQVLVRPVEGSAEDDGIELIESLGAVTQALTLDRSTTRRRFRVPPQQHPLTAQIAEPDICAVLIGQFEVRRYGVQRQHGDSLADRDRAVRNG
jgi:hypothetical protein